MQIHYRLRRAKTKLLLALPFNGSVVLSTNIGVHNLNWIAYISYINKHKTISLLAFRTLADIIICRRKMEKVIMTKKSFFRIETKRSED